ncbi:bola protein [Globomyces pollinis-pini]|nr:bola protein [Globomyces pollinis-pini]
MEQKGPIYTTIQSKINEALKPSVFEIHDDSHKHAGHAAMKGLAPKETHFRLVIVSDEFESKSLVQRHRLVYNILGEELKNGLHALALNTKTSTEFNKSS